MRFFLGVKIFFYFSLRKFVFFLLVSFLFSRKRIRDKVDIVESEGSCNEGYVGFLVLRLGFRVRVSG